MCWQEIVELNMKKLIFCPSCVINFLHSLSHLIHFIDFSEYSGIMAMIAITPFISKVCQLL